MPTYSYQCKDCGHAFDIFQKFSEDTLTVCPDCSGPIRRVIQPTPVVFKGSGWYINDSKGKSSTGTATKEETAKTSEKAAPAESATNGKSDVAAKSTDAPAKADKATDKTPAAAGAAT